MFDVIKADLMTDAFSLVNHMVNQGADVTARSARLAQSVFNVYFSRHALLLTSVRDFACHAFIKFLPSVFEILARNFSRIFENGTRFATHIACIRHVRRSRREHEKIWRTNQIWPVKM